MMASAEDSAGSGTQDRLINDMTVITTSNGGVVTVRPGPPG